MVGERAEDKLSIIATFRPRPIAAESSVPNISPMPPSIYQLSLPTRKVLLEVP